MAAQAMTGGPAPSQNALVSPARASTVASRVTSRATAKLPKQHSHSRGGRVPRLQVSSHHMHLCAEPRSLRTPTLVCGDARTQLFRIPRASSWFVAVSGCIQRICVLVISPPGPLSRDSWCSAQLRSSPSTQTYSAPLLHGRRLELSPVQICPSLLTKADREQS